MGAFCPAKVVAAVNSERRELRCCERCHKEVRCAASRPARRGRVRPAGGLRCVRPVERARGASRA